MRDWSKYFFLSFFTDKHTYEAYKRSLLNGIGCFLLSLLILMLTLAGGYMAAMPTHLSNATEYKQTICDALSNTNCTIAIQDGKISAFAQNNAVVINTFTDTENTSCKIIIDTRSIKDVYTTFEISYVSKEGTTILYDEYLALDETAQKEYSLQVKYFDTPIQFDDALLASMENYLSGVTDATMQASYGDLLARKQAMEKLEYAVELYELYVCAYYPQEVQALDLYTFAPTLHTYYEDLIDQNRSENFFVLYDDLIYARFYGEGNVFYSATASASQLKNHTIGDDSENLSKQIDNLFCDAFNASAGIVLVEYIFNVIRFCPFVVIGAIVLALICWLILKSTKNNKFSSYATVFQILLLYTPASALIGGITGFVLSWFVGRSSAYATAMLVYVAAICCRTIAYTVCTLIRERKNKTNAD